MWVIGLCSLVLFLVGLYVYFLSASVVHVVVRQEYQQTIKDLSSDIGQLETEYILAQHKLSADVANLEGYVVSEEKIFIDKTANSLVLSLNTPDRFNER